MSPGSAVTAEVVEEGWPFEDRGAAYGDGLFETVLVRDARPLLWEEHMARLARGCRVLGIPRPDPARLARPLAEAPQGLSVLKLMLTRGSGGRGYAPPDPPDPRLRWRLAPFVPSPPRWRQGVRVRHCRLRLGIQPALAGIKHLNRLENVLARAEWTDADTVEGLLCDTEGRLVASSTDSENGDRCGVAGTLRAALLERLPIREVDAFPEALERVEALWLGNSLQGLWPVVRLDDARGRARRHWTLGSDHRRLQAVAHDVLGYPTRLDD